MDGDVLFVAPESQVGDSFHCGGREITRLGVLGAEVDISHRLPVLDMAPGCKFVSIGSLNGSEYCPSSSKVLIMKLQSPPSFPGPSESVCSKRNSGFFFILERTVLTAFLSQDTISCCRNGFVDPQNPTQYIFHRE